MGVDIEGLAGLDIRRDGVDRLDEQMSVVDLPPTPPACEPAVRGAAWVRGA